MVQKVYKNYGQLFLQLKIWVTTFTDWKGKFENKKISRKVILVLI